MYELPHRGKIGDVENKQAKLPPPPGLIASLTAGFDVVANNILLISLPIVLDLFLWLGPRLSLKKFFQPAIEYFMANTSGLALEGLPDPAMIQQVWVDFLARFNLFSALRTMPVGVSSLMNGKLPQVNPFGKAMLIESESFLSLAGELILIILAGWLLGAVYFQWVSRVTLKVKEPVPMLRSLGNTVVLSVIWMFLLAVVGLPAFWMVSLVMLISPIMGQAILLLLAFFSIWIVLPFFFSPHGIFTYRQNALFSMLNSLRMARYTLPTSSLFLVILFIASLGLDYLWRMPLDESWLTVVGITGHAFISTALLSASFVYYRDVNSWLQSVFTQIKSHPKSIQV